MSVKYFFLGVVALIFMSGHTSAQENSFKKLAVKTGLGLAMNDANIETGMGLVYSFGLQKSYGVKDKFRINPNLLFGGFLPAGITDIPDQYYKLTTLGLDFHYDILRLEPVSLVATAGGFINYSRGLMGTGGMDTGRSRSDYFLRLYYGGKFGLAIRVDQKNKKLAYEFRPLNFQIGNKGFMLASFIFSVDIKLNDRTW